MVKKSLIVPIAGKSTRFPGGRPKWMLTHPLGSFMVIEAISGLNLNFFDKIYFIALTEHEKEYHFLRGFKENLAEKGLLKKSVITLLDKPTNSQPETIYQGVEKNKIGGFIFIKDCDNYFNLTLKTTDNQVSYCSLQDFTQVNPNNKSYISLNDKNIIENIIEKEIISTTFCSGGYGFQNAQDFIQTYEKLLKLGNKDLYVSDIIFDLILGGRLFFGNKCEKYSDWGCAQSWRKYCDTFRTIFADIDGCLIKSSSSHFMPYIGETSCLPTNVAYLQDLNEKENLYIILTTSRSEKYRRITEKQLKKYKIPYNQLIMDLPHAKRVLINDFSSTAPNPTAIAINLERDKDNLDLYL